MFFGLFLEGMLIFSRLFLLPIKVVWFKIVHMISLRWSTHGLFQDIGISDVQRDQTALSHWLFVQVSNEEAKQIEISKLQKMLEALNCELDGAKLATINESNKNAILQNQLQLSAQEKSALERELVAMNEVQKENALLKVLWVMLNGCVSIKIEVCYIYLFDIYRALWMPWKRRAQLWSLSFWMLKKTIMKPFRKWGNLNRRVLN